MIPPEQLQAELDAIAEERIRRNHTRRLLLAEHTRRRRYGLVKRHARRLNQGDTP